MVTEYREDAEQRLKKIKKQRAEVKTQQSLENTDWQNSMTFSSNVNCPPVGIERAKWAQMDPEISFKKLTFYKAYSGLRYSDC